METQLLTVESPKGVLDHSARFLAQERPAHTSVVVPRAYLKREFRTRLLEAEGSCGWLGAPVLTYGELFDYYLNQLPSRPVLSYAQLRQLVTALVREMHDDSGGRWFRGQVVGDRVSEATLRSLTHLLLELEPTSLSQSSLQDRLLTGAPSEVLTHRAQEVVELWRRYQHRLAENQYLGPKGQEIGAARGAAEIPPPHGIRRFRVLGIDGQFPTSPHIAWIEAIAEHPDVQRVEVVMLLPEEIETEAWATHANLPLYRDWMEQEGQRTILTIDQKDKDNGTLSALARAPFAFRTNPIESSEEVRGVRVPDEQLELEWVGSQIKRMTIEEVFPPNEIAVISRSMSDRAEEIERVFRDMGIPTVASYEIRLSEVPAVRALLLVFRLLSAGWKARDVIALAESPYLLPDVEPTVIRWVARRPEVPETGEGWVDKLTELAETALQGELPELDGVPDGAVTETADAFVAFEISVSELAGGEDGGQAPSEWVESLVAAVEHWDIEERIYAPHARIGAEERMRLARLDLDGLNEFLHAANDWLRGREVAGLEDLPIGAQAWQSELEEIAGANSIRVSSYPRQAVHLLEPAQAAYREFDVVFIIDLVDDRFPANRRSEDRVLSEEERRALNLPTRDEWLARERILFQFAVGAARRKLFLTAPAADERGKALVSSPFLTHMPLRIDGFEVEDLTAEQLLPRTVDDIRAHRDVDLLAALRYRNITDRPEASDAEIRQLLSEDGLLVVWHNQPSTRRVMHAWGVADLRDNLEAVLRANPWEQAELFEEIPMYGNFAGMFRPEQVPAWIREDTASFSPSEFNSFRHCHFRFFMEKVLGLREAIGREAGHNEAGAFGELQHRILELLYRRLRDDGLLPPQDPGDIDEALAKLEIVAREAVRERSGSEHEELWRLDLDVIQSLLRTFVAWDLNRMLRAESDPTYSDLRTRILQLETFLGGREKPINVESLDESFRLHGKIDRIEEVRDNRLGADFAAADGTLMIRDYKTSRWAYQPGADQFLKGKELQLPLYARMLRVHMEQYGDGANGRHIFGFGILATANPPKSGRLDVRDVTVGEGGEVTLRRNDKLGENPVFRAEVAALRNCAEAVKKMRAGRFAPQPDPDDWGCPLGPLCCQGHSRPGTGGGRWRFEMPVQIDSEELDEIERVLEDWEPDRGAA